MSQQSQRTDWQTKKLSEVCEVIAGQSPEGRFYNKTGNGLPFYQGKKGFAKSLLENPQLGQLKSPRRLVLATF